MNRDRPNILVVTTHDSGRHFGCYGVPTVRTPAIDQLAQEGVRLEHLFASACICSPARGSLLTGLDPLANGLVGLAGGTWNWELHDAHTHLSHRLRPLGYHTALFGIQHETRFLSRLGFVEIHAPDARDPSGQELCATRIAEETVAFLRSRRDRAEPFYAQVGFFETHTPYSFGGTAPDQLWGVWKPPYAVTRPPPTWARRLTEFQKDPEFARAHLAGFQGALHEVDRALARILEGLRETALESRTLVVFTTDHGPELPGAKWTLYDPGVAVAMILRWPDGGVAGGRVCSWLLSQVDFVPTLFSLLGEPRPPDLRGYDFSRGCRTDVSDQDSPRRAVFSLWVDGLNFSVRTARYKLIRNLVSPDPPASSLPLHELYDLHLDPLELINVVDEPAYREIRNALIRQLDQWLADLRDPTCFGPLPAVPPPQKVAEYRARYEALHGAFGKTSENPESVFPSPR